MRKLSLVLISFLASFSAFAQSYTPAQIEAILEENKALKAENAEYSELAQNAIVSLKESMNLKKMLKNAGLSVDKTRGKIKLINSEAFMSSCNVVIFTESEFDALNTADIDDNNSSQNSNNPQKPFMRDDDAQTEQDFRKASKGDFNEKSKDFWNNVIY